MDAATCSASRAEPSLVKLKKGGMSWALWFSHLLGPAIFKRQFVVQSADLHSAGNSKSLKEMGCSISFSPFVLNELSVS